MWDVLRPCYQLEQLFVCSHANLRDCVLRVTKDAVLVRANQAPFHEESPRGDNTPSNVFFVERRIYLCALHRENLIKFHSDLFAWQELLEFARVKFSIFRLNTHSQYVGVLHAALNGHLYLYVILLLSVSCRTSFSASECLAGRVRWLSRLNNIFVLDEGGGGGRG